MSISNQSQSLPADRPDFMVALGLLPPYSPADVKQAYFEKVKTAHPDKGGNVADFLKLQEAFRQATEYVEFRKSRIITPFFRSEMMRCAASSLMITI